MFRRGVPPKANIVNIFSFYLRFWLFRLAFKNFAGGRAGKNRITKAGQGKEDKLLLISLASNLRRINSWLDFL